MKIIKVLPKAHKLKQGSCRYSNRDPKVCLNCPNILSQRTFLGRIDKVYCKNEKILVEELPEELQPKKIPAIILIEQP